MHSRLENSLVSLRPWLLLFLAGIMFPRLSTAQRGYDRSETKRSVLWGFPIIDSKQYELVEFIGVEKSTRSSLWLAREDRIYMLEKFDSVNNRVLSKEINLLQVPGVREPQRVYVESILLVNNVVTVVTQFKDAKTSTVVIMVHQLSTDGEILTPPSKLTELSNPESSILVSLSPDSARLAVGVSSPSSRISRKNQFFVWILDMHMQPVFENNFLFLPESVPDTTKVEGYQMVISREQKVFVLAQQRGRVDDNGPLSVWGIDPTTSEVGQLQLHPGHRMKTAHLRMNSREEIIVCGLYYDTGETQYRGLFYGMVNPRTLSIDRPAYLTIPKVTDRPAVSKVQSVTLIPRSDGGFIFLAEDLSGLPYKIHFENILVCNIAIDGSSSFCVTIPKAQHHYIAASLTQYSFFQVYNADTQRLQIIFNENPKNLSPERKRNIRFPMVLPNHAVPVIITVDPDGTTTCSHLLDETLGIVLFPVNSTQVSGHKAFIVGRKKRQFAIGSLTLD